MVISNNENDFKEMKEKIENGTIGIEEEKSLQVEWISRDQLVKEIEERILFENKGDKHLEKTLERNLRMNNLTTNMMLNNL